MVLMIVLSLLLGHAFQGALRVVHQTGRLFVPLFSVVILIPSMTNLITPGQSFGPSLQLFGFSIYLTKEGLTYAAVHPEGRCGRLI